MEDVGDYNGHGPNQWRQRPPRSPRGEAGAASSTTPRRRAMEGGGERPWSSMGYHQRRRRNDDGAKAWDMRPQSAFSAERGPPHSPYSSPQGRPWYPNPDREHRGGRRPRWVGDRYERGRYLVDPFDVD